MVVLLSNAQKHSRSVESKDSSILRKSSPRSQFTASNKLSTSPKINEQSGIPQPSTSSASSSSSSAMQAFAQMRGKSSASIEGLDRMVEQFDIYERSHTLTFSNNSGPVEIKSSILRSIPAPIPVNPMQLYALDVAEVIEKNQAT